jgi:hypothetical protein
LAGMSPHSGVSQVPRLRAETHFGVQARALPVELHNKSHSARGPVMRNGSTLPSSKRQTIVLSGLF